MARGGGLAFISHKPRCLSIFFMISGCSMTLITRIREAHLGHVKGSTFPDQIRGRLQFSVSDAPSSVCTPWMTQPVPEPKVSAHPGLFFPFAPGYVAVIAIIPDHLFSLVWHMGTPVFAWLRRGKHGGQPFEGVKDLLFFPIPRSGSRTGLRFIDNLGLSRQVSHPLLGKGSPDAQRRRSRCAKRLRGECAVAMGSDQAN